MASTQIRKSQAGTIALSELSCEFARLDLTRPESLGSQIVNLVAQGFLTDRVSLAFVNTENCTVVQAFQTGFDVPMSDWRFPSPWLNEACLKRASLFVENISLSGEAPSAWSGSYRTDAFVIYQLPIQRRMSAVLCISNLSAQQVRWVRENPDATSVFLAQLAQLGRLMAAHWDTVTESQPAQDEIALLSKLMDRVDRGINTKDVFSVFAEVVSELLPIDALAIIHDRLREPAQGVVCLQRPVHQSDLDALYHDLAQQWRRRHKSAPEMNLTDARVLGKELLMVGGECPEELRLKAIEVFPIFLDNDLFALAAVAVEYSIDSSRRQLKVLNTLLQQLLLHVKKELLMTQNQDLQTVDSLTGLYNERHFYELSEREFDRAKRYNLPLSILFIDIDHFKDVNDTYGFETGDLVLQELSRIIIENMRTTDFVSRYSGERFVVVLPETHYKNAEMMANRLRRYIENYSFYIANSSVFIKVTASVGVASYLDHKPTSVAQFIEFADTALYFAKRNGRNQVVGYSYVINLMIGDTRHKG